MVLSSSNIEATVEKGYVTGVAAGTFLDKKSGFRDAGYGLDIVDQTEAGRHFQRGLSQLRRQDSVP